MTTALPPLFALAPGPDRCTRIYQATLLQESPPPSAYGYGAATESPPIFLVTPYLLPQPQPAEAFRYTAPELPPAAFRGEVLLVADVDDPPFGANSRGHRRTGGSRRAWSRDGFGFDDDYDPPSRTDPLRPRRDVFYHGTVSLTRRTILSFCCAAPIPILEFDGAFRGPWPVAPERIALYESTPALHRAWRRRWDPDTWYEELSAPAAAEPIPVLFPPEPAPTAPTSLPPIVTRPHHAPGFVTDALVRDALQRAATCPITLEPLTATTPVAVTDCYHLFDATALATWRAAGDNKCPVCRQIL
jgi:hypothetical protein